MSEITYYTKEGYEALREELHRMKTVDRHEISQQIAEAREKGDLSENAEYDAAKDAQGMLELKISRLEGQLANARILDESQMDTSRVYILCNVRLKNHNVKKEMTYRLVAAAEANLKEGKISVDSPIGKGLLGKEVGDIVEVEVPAGKLKLEVLEITR